ncbi:adenylate kinase 7-like [Agrilus planipennis]|uniref:Adenylate kinase 7-like n=1 Tax=Agrilus planipennis TaxID=224129 RepID=A0A1W4WS61_AGRPL|nr:adenylate kinase 7-like [Agrilus planipennis]
MDSTQATTVTTLFNTAETGKIATEPEPAFTRYRVFFNHVDSFNVKYISAFLTEKIFGASRTAAGGGEEMLEEEEEKSRPVYFGPDMAKNYEIIGTLRYQFHRPTEDISKVIKETDEDFFTQVFNCGFIVYDITEDPSQIQDALDMLTAIEKEIESVKDIGPKTFERWDETRVFILLSTVMTWGKSKPVDPEDPTAAFTEGDYRRRKPHPNYQAHIDCEKEVILKGKKYKDKLKTYVIASGIPYGHEEETLDFLFKLAWRNESEMPVFGNGKNYVPLIHVEDLAKVIHAVCENTPSKPQYILAVEQSASTLKQIVGALSKVMGTGRIKEVPQEEAFLIKNITQAKFDKTTVNLNMEPEYITEEAELEWKNDMNLFENMKAIVNEFRIARNLVPVKLFVHGPPASGKTSVSKALSGYYGSHYTSVKSAIDETIENLRNKIDREKEKQRLKEEAATGENAEEEEVGEEGEEEEEVNIDDLIEELKGIEIPLEESENGKLPDEQAMTIVKKILSQNYTQNQGYVLDGYPKLTDQAKLLFTGDEEGEGGADEEEEEGEGGGRGKILPDYVINLTAPDEFLCERIMLLPEKRVQGTHYTEEHMLRRLDEFRARNTEDNTILNFFDEREIPIITIDITSEQYREADDIVRTVVKKVGPPPSFAPTPEEEFELIGLQQEKERLERLEKELAEELMKKDAIECYQNKMEQWTSILEQYQLEEEKILAAECEPLRHYLMKYVFPTLSKGLIETAIIKPEDPIDFLAEFLFKENPEGRMFDPSYSRDGQQKLETCVCIKCCEDEDSEDTPC